MTPDAEAEPAEQKPAYEPFTPDALEMVDSGGMETLESKDLQLLMEVEKLQPNKLRINSLFGTRSTSCISRRSA